MSNEPAKLNLLLRVYLTLREETLRCRRFIAPNEAFGNGRHPGLTLSSWVPADDLARSWSNTSARASSRPSAVSALASATVARRDLKVKSYAIGHGQEANTAIKRLCRQYGVNLISPTAWLDLGLIPLFLGAGCKFFVVVGSITGLACDDWTKMCNY